MFSPKRLTRMVIALIAVIALLVPLCFSVAEDEMPMDTTPRSPIVRVRLTRLGLTDRVDLALNCPYVLESDTGTLRFAEGSELSLLLRDEALYLYYQSMSMQIGQRITLRRQLNEAQAHNGFTLVNYPAMYEGDLTLSISEGLLRPVLNIHVEDYLLGVVPYEMSNAFPLEALKAQTVAARTYALRKQNQNSDYDVVDTTNDQVYRGYLEGYERVEQAIRETRGVCGFYKGQLAQCYYAASNGGQTELVSTVWPTDDDYGYYAFGEDPYDVENPTSTVRSIVLQKDYSESESAPYGLRSLLADQLRTELIARGYDPSPESIQVNAISDVRVDTPQGAEGSKLMTSFHMTVKISGRTKTEVLPVEDPDTEEVSLFDMMEEPTQTPAPTQAAVNLEPIEPTPTATPQITYGGFVPIDKEFTLDMSIFPAVEAAFAMDITSHYDNELWSVKETADAFTVQSRRYGHGVGMSQRGAEWMAVRYQKTYTDILAFYYPGMELLKMNETDIGNTSVDEQLLSTPGPAPSPTPRPTLMPATMEAGEGQWFALVTEIDDDSSLNLRSVPDMSGEILQRLYKNQRLLVLERCEEEGWVHVQTDVIDGYVVENYLTKE